MLELVPGFATAETGSLGSLILNVLFSSVFATWALFVGLVLFALLVITIAGLFFFSRVTVYGLVWLFFKCFYRIEVHNADRFPRDGPALLVANHVSWLDGLLIQLVNPRPIRMMVYGGNFKNPILKYFTEVYRAIHINPGPKAIARALKTAREGLQAGDVVGIFPEGGITRSGNLQTFRPGLTKILKGTDAPVFPVYFDGFWGSIFSFEGGKFFWKIPKRWRYPVSVHYGEPMYGVTSVHEVRQAVQKLGAQAVEKRIELEGSLPESYIRSCKRRKFGSKFADSTGADLTGGNALMRTLILRRLLRRHVLAADEKYVGVLLPPSAPAALVNLALALDKRVAVNLNYTVSADVMNDCIQQAGIRHVLTSGKVMDKLDLKIDSELVMLDELRDKVTLGDKVSSAVDAFVTPTGMLSAKLGLKSIKPDDELTVIFTSGSTGSPKGVVLTHANIKHNAEAVNTIIRLTAKDVLIGILPFFHSFGYTVTLWVVSSLNIKGIYHFNPLDAKQVGKLCKKHHGTILLSTPTFLRSYLRRCSKEEFATIDTVVAGAERLPKELCDAFEQKFGVRPVEGYGATELSPLVAVNVPPSRGVGNHQVDAKEGTVGRALPGVSARVVDMDRNEELGVGEAGMLQIKGGNVMKGYMNQPEKTNDVIKDGWYITGDVAEIDGDGFIKITGRESRFSKIGGEMVPHIKVEETLIEVLGVDDDEGPQIAVTAVPDEKKGERLVVLHETISKTPDELRSLLQERGLPNIFIPSADCFFLVDEVPVLGTGKLDLRALKESALELCGISTSG